MGTNNKPLGVATVIADYATAVAVFTSGDFIVKSPWLTSNSGTGKLDAIRSHLRVTYGAKVLDSEPMWAKHHARGANMRRGTLPPGFTTDNLHHTSQGVAEGLEHAAMLRAMAGARRTSTMSRLGSGRATRPAPRSSTRASWARTSASLRLPATTIALALNIVAGAIMRGDAAPSGTLYELFLRGRSNKLLGNIARIEALQQMDRTAPTRAVRIRGSGASVLTTPGLAGALPGKLMTLALCARFNRTKFAPNRGTMVKNPFSHPSSSPNFRIVPRTAAGR